MLKIASRFPGVSNGDRANATAATIQRGTVSASNCPKSCPAIKWAATTPSPSRMEVRLALTQPPPKKGSAYRLLAPAVTLSA